MKTKLLIDGDILVYRLGFAVQTRNSEIEPPRNALHLVKKTVKDMQKKFDTDNVKIYLTANDKSNFRYKLATIKPYKGNRDPKINPKAPPKPHYYSAIRRYIEGTYNCTVVKGMEADDALGIHQMKHIDDPFFETIICSIDKDLDMIPGLHYNFVTDTLYRVSDPGTLSLSENHKKIRGEGLKWFYAQMLMGDSADNIPGLSGFGPVKVYETLKECETEEQMWVKVQGVYLDRLMESGLTYENVYSRLHEVADLLWMWRTPTDCKSAHLKTLITVNEDEVLK